ncbi:Uma2 family endonuclease [Cryptosporangium phraense]|nr:Uma2 family endonuclease [Cryptosporangium phraense]
MTHATQAVPGERPMSWDEYDSLGPDIRGEYIDGNLVVSPSPARTHQRICRRLANLIEAVVPDGIEVDEGWAWKPGRDEFVPDVLVYPHTDETVRFTGMPLLAVEVLSTNRGDDLVRKTTKYAEVGLRHYWIVDPRDHLLDAYELQGGVYHRTGRLLDDESGELSFGAVTVKIDLGDLLGS